MSRKAVVPLRAVQAAGSAVANRVFDAQAIVRVVAEVLEQDSDLSRHMLFRALSVADSLLDQAGEEATEVGDQRINGEAAA